MPDGKPSTDRAPAPRARRRHGAAGGEQAAVVGARPRRRLAPRRHRQAHSRRQVHQLADPLQPDGKAEKRSDAPRHLVQQGAGDARTADPPGRRRAGDDQGRPVAVSRRRQGSRVHGRRGQHAPPQQDAEHSALRRGLVADRHHAGDRGHHAVRDVAAHAPARQEPAWVVVFPDGREQTILNVPKFDFNWQIKYELAEPLHIPAGSKILGIGNYDNSPKKGGTRRRTSRSTGRSRAGTKCTSRSRCIRSTVRRSAT